MISGRRVLVIFPHPDDEAYSCGGTIARLASDGAEVTVLCATDGDAGKDRRTAESTGALRFARCDELACSCEKLGAAPTGAPSAAEAPQPSSTGVSAALAAALAAPGLGPHVSAEVFDASPELS